MAEPRTDAPHLMGIALPWHPMARRTVPTARSQCPYIEVWRWWRFTFAGTVPRGLILSSVRWPRSGRAHYRPAVGHRRYREADQKMSESNSDRRLSDPRQSELEVRFRELDADRIRQRQIIKDLEQDGHKTIGAETMLRLIEREQSAIIEELGYSPRAN